MGYILKKIKKKCYQNSKYIPIQFGIFLTFATIKVVGEPKQQNLISAKKFVKRTGCLQPSNSLPEHKMFVQSMALAPDLKYLIPSLNISVTSIQNMETTPIKMTT